MSKSYQNMMGKIHAPDELSERVLFAARRGPVPALKQKKCLWLKPALCTACAFAILIGSFSVFRNMESLGAPNPEFPFDGLIMTACAAEAPVGNPNGGLGLTMEKNGAGRCLFQIRGAGIQTLELSIEGGKLYHEGTDEELTEIEEDYLAQIRYGVLLDGDSATLTVTANKEHAFTYFLTQEDLRMTQDEDGQVMLVPQLTGDPVPGIPGIYAASLDDSRWFAWPLEKARTIDLSMPYGERVHSVTGQTSFHAGIDIPAAEDTAIGAAADGKVVETGFDPTYGNYVVLDHGGGLVTRYHQCKEICVADDAQVKAGDTIALVGKTGMAVGAHLHFEVRQDGVAQDPTAYFDAAVRSQLDVA